jgi:hypothetical protein
MALFFLFALAFITPTFFGYVFCRSDLKLLFFPWHEFIRSAFLRGELPLWDPTIMCGVPFLASNLPAGLFYPLRLALFPLPYHLALSAYICLHLFVAGTSMFFFLKSCRLRASSCFFGGIAFMYAPYLIGRIPYLAEFTLLCLAPLGLLITRYVCEQKSARSVALGAALFACFHFVGQPQLLYPLSIAMGIFWADSLVREIKHGVPFRQTCFIAFPSMLVLGTLMASVVLVPFAEYVMYSDRAKGLSYSQFAARSLPLYELAGLFLPNPFGANSIEWLYPNWARLQRCLTPYLGVIPFAMLFYSGALKKPKYLISIIVLLLWAVGPTWGWFELFYQYVPGLRFMRIPERTVPLACLFLTICSAFGFERFLNLLDSNRMRATFFAVSMGGVILLLLCVGFLLLANPEYSVALARLTRSPGYASILEHTLPSIAATILFLSLFSLLAALVMQGKISVRGNVFALILLTVVNLLPVAFETQFMTQKKFLYATREIWDSELAFIKNNALPETRIFLPFKKIDGIGFQLEAELLPNVGHMQTDIMNASGYNCLLLERYRILERAVEGRLTAPKKRLLSLMAVKYYFAAAHERPPTDWPAVYGPTGRTAGLFAVYRNPGYVPRVHLVTDFKISHSPDEVLHKMGSTGFDPMLSVILEKDIKGYSNPPGGHLNASASVVESGLNRVVIDISAEAECLLVLSDTFYPGWTATVNEKVTPIYRGNLLFRVVRIPAGISRVVFQYRPRSFVAGTMISLIIVITCLFLGSGMLHRRAK